jgi:hypothetical protein
MFDNFFPQFLTESTAPFGEKFLKIIIINPKALRIYQMCFHACVKIIVLLGKLFHVFGWRVFPNFPFVQEVINNGDIGDVVDMKIVNAFLLKERLREKMMIVTAVGLL